MPCYETNLISADLKTADKTLLEEALHALGLKFYYSGETLYIQTPSGSITVTNGKASLSPAAQPWLNKIKQAYSLKTVEKVAQRYRFNVTVKGDNKLTLRKY